MTRAEAALWSRLRNRQIGGAKIRRQAPVGPYIVDFLCRERRLIIEIDGGQHAVTLGRDASRTAFLESRGYTVMRFWNNEVLANIDGVLQAISERLRPPFARDGEPGV